MNSGNLICLTSYPVSDVLDELLRDKSTGENIIFATDTYADEHPLLTATAQIFKDYLLGPDAIDLRPRVLKSRESQASRTKKNAEVFTPSWVCNKMNNHCDAEWFGKDGVFNTEDGESWTVNPAPVEFPEGKTWQQYVGSTRLEITCGEAPYIVSRYDASTGELIPIERRIGILDRKLRVVNENAADKETWLKWAYRAFQSVYGFEYQGDSLLVARINLLMTFVDYVDDRWGKKPTKQQLKKIANIISWNLWQMDGITGTVPFAKTPREELQMSFFDLLVDESIPCDDEEKTVDVKIYDWRSKKPISYSGIKEGR